MQTTKKEIANLKVCIIHEKLIVKADSETPRAGESSTVLLKDGSIMLVYAQFSGNEDHDFAVIVSRISKDGGINWSQPEILMEKAPDALNVMSPSLLRLQNGNIAFLYLQKFSKGNCIPYMCQSEDEGKTWAAAVPVAKPGKYYVVNNDRLMQTENGRLIIPVAEHSYNTEIDKWEHKSPCGVFYSDDNGLSWNKSKNFITIKNSNVVPPSNLKKKIEEEWEKILNEGICCQEPGIVELSGNRLMMWARTSGGYMYRAVSEDGGETWSDFKPVTSIISPLAPQSIKRLPGSSRLVCIYNDHKDLNFLEENWNWRTPFSIAISDDDGESWDKICDFEDKSHNYCYASMLFFDGKLLSTYYFSDNYIEDNVPKRRNLASLKLKIIKL